jgi:hypothetical protein
LLRRFDGESFDSQSTNHLRSLVLINLRSSNRLCVAVSNRALRSPPSDALFFWPCITSLTCITSLPDWYASIFSCTTSPLLHVPPVSKLFTSLICTTDLTCTAAFYFILHHQFDRHLYNLHHIFSMHHQFAMHHQFDSAPPF